MSDMKQQMAQTAAAMVAQGKGILAIDESTPTIKKRFDTSRSNPRRKAGAATGNY